MSGNSKKAFDAPYSSSPVYYPDELSIVGGKDHIEDARERGPLDTKAPTEPDVLYRPARLAMPLKEGFVISIDLNTVMVPISIVSRDGVPTVEFGQSRTRGARAANFERKKQCGVTKKSDREAAEICAKAGFPLISIKCEGKKNQDELVSLQRIWAENHMRNDDDPETQVKIVTMFLDRMNNDFALVAKTLQITEQTVRFLANYQVAATAELKAAVKAGLGITSAAHIAKEADPVKQREALTELLKAKPTVRRAQQLTKRNPSKPSTANPFQGKKALVKFKAVADAEKAEDPFFDGVRALLELQTTGATQDKRLKKLFEKYTG